MTVLYGRCWAKIVPAARRAAMRITATAIRRLIVPPTNPKDCLHSIRDFALKTVQKRVVKSGEQRGERGNFEIGRKPISNPKSEISDWTVQFKIVQLRI